MAATPLIRQAAYQRISKCDIIYYSKTWTAALFSKYRNYIQSVKISHLWIITNFYTSTFVSFFRAFVLHYCRTCLFPRSSLSHVCTFPLPFSLSLSPFIFRSYWIRQLNHNFSDESLSCIYYWLIHFLQIHVDFIQPPQLWLSFLVLIPSLPTPLIDALCDFHLFKPDLLSRSFSQIAATPMNILICFLWYG